MALIDIGSSKQLFLDDFLIESMTDARQVMNPAEKVAHNPIIEPEYPWEGNYLSGSDIFFDEQEQLFKMKYHALYFRAYLKNGEVVIEGEGSESQRFTCLAASQDGMHWNKPMLGLVEFEGSRENNILPQEQALGGFKDLHEEDPAKRYKAMVQTGSTDTSGMKFDLYYSPDNFHWVPIRGQSRHRPIVHERSVGATQFHGLGSDPPGLCRTYGELPAPALSFG